MKKQEATALRSIHVQENFKGSGQVQVVKNSKIPFPASASCKFSKINLINTVSGLVQVVSPSAVFQSVLRKIRAKFTMNTFHYLLSVILIIARLRSVRRPQYPG